MALVDSLLSAIVRADGDALVMHVGERPYVVVGTQTINISTHGLNLDAMTGMLAQLLPADSQTQLEEFGAVEYRIPQHGNDRFSVVAARGGDDIWIEIRRRRVQPALPAEAVAAAEPSTAPMVIVEEPVPPAVAGAVPDAIAELVAEPIPEPIPDVFVEPAAALIEAPSAPTIEALEERQPVFLQPFEEAQPIAIELEANPPAPVFEWPVPADAESEAVGEPMVEHTAIQEEPIAAPEIFEPLPTIEPVLAEISAPAAVPVEPLVEAPQLTAPEVLADESAAPTAEPLVEPIAAEPIAEEPIAAEPVAEPVAWPAEPIVQADQEPPAMAAAPAPEPGTAPEPEAARAPESAVILPMTRTVRVEVPPRTAAAARSTTSGIERLLRVAAARGASALFLTSDSRPWIRVEGDLRQLESESPLSRADVESAVVEIAPESGHESIGESEATEWIVEFADVGRIRCTTFADHRGPGVLLRMIATRAATAEQLGLVREVQALATEPQGIVLVAGPRAGGKSTMISALVDLVNRQRAEFVITLERQIRLIHDNKSALVSQREIRGGAEDSVAAARSALRENPDVLVIDDLLSPQMVPLVLTAASEGLLVFVSITAPSTADAVQRFIELAPPEMRKAVLSAMAESFRGAVAQVLLKKSGGGLVAAREVLLATAPVTRVIGEGQLAQLPLALDSGRKHGMVSFTDALADFVRAGTVDVREAFRKAPDRGRLLDSLKRDGVDTSAVERLA